MVDTTVTTSTITAVRVSQRRAQFASKLPDAIQVSTSTVKVRPPIATSQKATNANTEETIMAPQVTICAPRSPMTRPPKPAIRAPTSGRKTIAEYIRQPFIRLMSSTAIEPRLRK